MIEAELEARGVPYRCVSTVEAGNVELPGAHGRFVRLINRGAVLAREDVEVTGATSGRFETTVQIRTPHGTFGLTRGWAAADAGGVRFVTTHLELAGMPDGAAVQLAQARELADGPAAVDGPVVAVGDFNAVPGSPTYQALADAGFADAWPADDPGPTCCHRFPLDDPAVRLRRRIDLVLTRGPVRAVHAERVGHRPEDFRDGVWPSDHAGVVAALQLR
jgi:endonuclease/exonuclease/phosphatase family metal-dependent hydrolase